MLKNFYIMDQEGNYKPINVESVDFDETSEPIPVLDDMEFSMEIESVNIEELKDIFGITAPGKMGIEFTAHEIRTDKLHKKKRISKKWAKQGKYRVAVKKYKGESIDIDKEEKGEITEYTLKGDIRPC